jgi:hypothetical protein
VVDDVGRVPIELRRERPQVASVLAHAEIRLATAPD